MTLLTNTGTSLNEVALAAATGARAADWADYNGDGKPDLLLATPQGPMLFTNQGENRFSDESQGLPRDAYYNVTAAAWLSRFPRTLVAAGAIMFAVSDLIIFARGGRPSLDILPVNVAVWGLYFAGQVLIVLGVTRAASTPR